MFFFSRKKDKRLSSRKKAASQADLVYKKAGTGIRKYKPVWIMDHSKAGFCVSSRECIDANDLTGIRFNVLGKEEYETVKFVWIKMIGSKYYLGLRKTHP